MVIFLSRLCGGEYAYPTNTATINFLSRLCGGEFRVGLY